MFVILILNNSRYSFIGLRFPGLPFLKSVFNEYIFKAASFYYYAQRFEGKISVLGRT